MMDPFTSAYVYAGNNPVMWNDPMGDIKVQNNDEHTYAEFGYFSEFVGHSSGGRGGGGGFPSIFDHGLLQSINHGWVYAELGMHKLASGDQIVTAYNQMLAALQGAAIASEVKTSLGLADDYDGTFSFQDGQQSFFGARTNGHLLSLSSDLVGSDGSSMGAGVLVFNLDIFAGSGHGDPKCPTCLNPSTVGNWFFIYGGPHNPKSNNGDDNYELKPNNISDKQAYIHHKDYDAKGAVGGLDLVLNFSVIQADMKFVKNRLAISGLYATQIRPAGSVWIYTPTIDLVTKKPISFGTAANALIQGVGLGIITAPKI